jgi:NAD(P)H-nitrite reductase large subunit
MGVTYADVEDAMHGLDKFSEVLDTFKKVQDATSCSTGCGGCYNEILDAISEIMHA